MVIICIVILIYRRIDIDDDIDTSAMFMQIRLAKDYRQSAY
jgi:hypothetical protein